MAMAIGKQTLFFVLPVFVCWTFLKRANKTSLLNLFVFWSITIAGVLSYYLTVHQIISSFSSPGSTKNMATGMLTWLFSTPLNIGIRQLAEFLSLGFFGLLAPLSLVAAIYLRSPKFVSTHQGLLIVLTVMAMLQPYLSGPIITDRSIMRLESLALVPLLLIGVAKAGENSLSIAPKTLIALISILFLSSFHHLFSVLGPNLELRKVFACTQTALLLFFFYIFYRALGLSTNEPSTPPSSHDA
ncbi:MAG: hypothetical protein NTV34_12480 [Proteobacteria bacterium]|nr:hypothetical protein [Pseudomonadota bacterium]